MYENIDWFNPKNKVKFTTFHEIYRELEPIKIYGISNLRTTKLLNMNLLLDEMINLRQLGNHV